MECQWVLADIPNFPFHYANFLYRNDSCTKLLTINAQYFVNPLREEGGGDVIIVTTVFEHLNNPLFISGYLLERLNAGGLLVFDFIKSEGHGLDHPNAVAEREEYLNNILEQVKIIKGNVSDISKSISRCIGVKK